MEEGLAKDMSARRSAALRALFYLPPLFFIALFVCVWPGLGLGPATGKNISVVLLTGLLSVWLGSILLLGRKELPTRSGSLIIAVLAMPPLWGLLVSLPSGLSITEIGGLGFEPDSIITLAIFSLWSIASLVWGRRTKPLFAFSIFAIALVILSAWQGSAGFFVISHDAPLLGDPFSQALAIAALSIVCLSAYLFRPLSSRLRGFFGGSALLGALSFISAPFPALTMSLGILSLALLYIHMFKSRVRGTRNPPPRRGAILLPALITASLFVLAFWGYGLARNVGIKEPSGELRLSPAATVSIIAQEYLDDPRTAFIGVGAGNFPYVWNMYRPIAANRSVLWNTEDITTFGLLPTLAATTGAPMVFATLLLILILTAVVGRSLASWDPAESISHQALPFGLGAAFALAWLAFYLPSTAYIGMCGALTGLYLATVTKVRADAPLPRSGVNRALSLGLGVVSLAFILFGGAGVWRALVRGSSLTLYAGGVRALQEGSDAESAADLMRRAYRVEGLPLIGRSISSVDREQVRAIVESSGVPPSDEERMRISDLMREAIADAEDAARADPSNFRNPLERAYILTVAALITEDRAMKEEAQRQYDTAIFFARAHPLPYFAKAQGLLLFGDRDGATRALTESLRLKPDYELALSLQQSLAAPLTPRQK